MTVWSSPGFAEVAEMVRLQTGLTFPAIRAADVETTLRRLMGRRGIVSPADLHGWLEQDTAAREAVVAELTIGETYFHRDPAQVSLLREQILPAALERAGAQPLRIWSAGCASGEEAYTIAMLLDELDALDRAEILGTDISRTRLEQAQRGTYSHWSLRATPQDTIERYFTTRGRDGTRSREFVLHPRIRASADFRYLNLAEDSYPRLADGIWGMDLILCRNVLIYFDAATVARVAERLLCCLSADGWLMLGASDPAISELVECDVSVTAAGLIYRRRVPGRSAQPDTLHNTLASGHATSHATFDVQPPAPVDIDVPVPVVQPFADVHALPADADVAHNGELEGNSEEGAVEAAYARRDYDAVDALASAKAARAALTEREWAAWLRALANGGRTDDAMAVLERAARHAPRSAELQYLRAVLMLQAGDAARALDAARAALYLDRGYVLAHMTMADAHLRAGERDDARRSLRNAAAALAGMDASAEVPGGDGETAGRMTDLVRVKLGLLEAA